MCSLNNMFPVDIEIDYRYRAGRSGISGNIILIVMTPNVSSGLTAEKQTRVSDQSFLKNPFKKRLARGKHPLQIRIATILRIVLKDFEKQLDIHP